MREDPIVAEVHKTRREILARFNGDVDAYSRYIQSVQAEKRKRGVRYVDAPPPRNVKLTQSDAA